MWQSKNLSNLVHFTDFSQFDAIKQLGDTVLLGNWFLFFKEDWHKYLDTEWFAKLDKSESELSNNVPEYSQVHIGQPRIIFSGQEQIQLPHVTIDARSFPSLELVSLTCDKSLYRVGRDTVRLLLVAPQKAVQELTLSLTLNGSVYAQYSVTLDRYGLAPWSMRDLPEGEYTAKLLGTDASICHFEVAEYRLSPFNAELVEQELNGTALRYTLALSAFSQPYNGPLEIELTERGQRIGERVKLRSDVAGRCQGTVKLQGDGPYALNIIAGSRSATVVLKGSEKQRRETITVSSLGEEREMSLLPFAQANMCRGMYITRGGNNNEPFLVQRLIGRELEIIARTAVDGLCAVMVDPAQATSEVKYYGPVGKDQRIQLPVPSPYGIVLLGATINGQPWEGWCVALHPSDLHIRCEAPKQAKPGSSITITCTTDLPDRVVPVQLIVKDQRLTAPSDPQVELAASIKKNLTRWHLASTTGNVGSPLWQSCEPLPVRYRSIGALLAAPVGAMAGGRFAFSTAVANMDALQKSSPLPKIRMQFPEVIYNNIIYVQQQASVEIKLGDSITRYTVEAFALEPGTLDWQRNETTIDAVQPLYGELTLSPFVFSGDPVMGQLHVGASSGAAMVEVRHDDEILPLFEENGTAVQPGTPIPSGSMLRFPVRPGAIMATVRDASKGGVDVSERYITEPGKLRHIKRYLRILNPGDAVTLRDLQALEIRPLPGLEQPFAFFVQGASNYLYGCVEQTSSKLFAMFTGYILNQDNTALSQEYAAVIPAWHKRLQSMYQPNKGFCFYPPEETSGQCLQNRHYETTAVHHLLKLPDARHSGVQQKEFIDIWDNIRTMTENAAAYYQIAILPERIEDCHDAYRAMSSSITSQDEKQAATAFVHEHLVSQGLQMYVTAQEPQKFYGTKVARRIETAYAAATLLLAHDLQQALALTNYVTSQFNEEGRLYSTTDTAACLALLLELRKSGILSASVNAHVALNGQELPLNQALAYKGKVESLRCLAGIATIQVTAEFVEDWGAFTSTLPVKVRLEKDGIVQQHFSVGDALDLVISVSHYEPGLLTHICLPDALARVVGGGQVKRFSLDFRGQNELRIPLAAVGATILPGKEQSPVQKDLLRWFGKGELADEAQHWAVIVRNMFKEEVVGNPGLLQVVVKES